MLITADDHNTGIMMNLQAQNIIICMRGKTSRFTLKTGKVLLLLLLNVAVVGLTVILCLLGKRFLLQVDLDKIGQQIVHFKKYQVLSLLLLTKQQILPGTLGVFGIYRGITFSIAHRLLSCIIAGILLLGLVSLLWFFFCRATTLFIHSKRCIRCDFL